MPNSPVLWGPNNTALNLQNQEQLATGELLQNDGPKNLITYNRFESGLTTGWSLGTTGTLTNGIPTGTPTFGSGAAGTLAITATSTTPIDGTYSLSYADSAATTAGNMVASQAYTVQPLLQAKTLGFKFSYQAITGAANMNFSGTSSNSYGVACYDVTNSAWLSTTGQFNLVQNSGAGVATGTVTTASTTASLRFVVYNVTATAGAATLYLDNFSLGPQITSIAPALGPGTLYTPTFVGFGTPVTSVGSTYRDGQFLVGSFYVQTGTNTAVNTSMSLPSGLNIDTSVNPQTTTVVGGGGASGTPFAFNLVTSTGTSTSLLYLTSAAGNAFTNAVGTAWGNGTTLSGSFRVPIAGWSSNTVSSADTDSRVIAMRVVQSSTTSIPNNSATKLLSWNAATIDTAGGWSVANSNYVVPVSGLYQVNASVVTTGGGAVAAATFQGLCYVNNAFRDYCGFNDLPVASINGAAVDVKGLCIVQVNAGDTIDLRSFQNCGATQTTAASSTILTINRLSGPAVVQATDSVNACYQNSASTSIANSGEINVPYATKVFDSHNAWSGTQYTIPISGKFLISGTVSFQQSVYAVANFLQAVVYKNGSAYAYGPVNSAQTITSIFLGVAVTAEVSCNAGDTIEIRVQNNRTAGATLMSATAAANHVDITRIGN